MADDILQDVSEATGANVDASTLMNLVRAGITDDALRNQLPLAEAGQTSFVGIGQRLDQNPLVANAWIGSLVNRIGGVILDRISIENPLAQFKRGIKPNGRAIEEIAIDVARERIFDPQVAETDLYVRENPDVVAIFHTATRDVFYKQTVQNTVMQDVLTDITSVSQFVYKIIRAMVNGNNADEFYAMKRIFSEAIAGQAIKTVAVDPTDLANYQFQIMKTTRLFAFPSRDYNLGHGLGQDGLKTQTTKENLRIFMTVDQISRLDVMFFANLFQLDRAEAEARIVEIDSFPSVFTYNAPHTVVAEDITNGYLDGKQFKVGDIVPAGTPVKMPQGVTKPADVDLKLDGSTVSAVIADKDFLQVWDVFAPYLTSQDNTEGRYRQVMLHGKEILSASTFVNSLAFVNPITPGE